MPSFQLSDHRTLEYEEFGEGRTAVVFHHSTPIGPGEIGTDFFRQLGCRVLAPIRPGYRGSTPNNGRTVASFAFDVAELLDHLEVNRACFYGISGGGPHALACAAVQNDRTAATFSDCGPAPLTSNMTPREYFGDAAFQLQSYEFLRDSLDEPEPWLTRMIEVIQRGGAPAPASLAPYFREDGDGWWADSMAFASRPWGFELNSIQAPAYIFRAGNDQMVPSWHAEALVAAIGDSATLVDVPQASHPVIASGGLPKAMELLREFCG